jgi:hypothetical protein
VNGTESNNASAPVGSTCCSTVSPCTSPTEALSIPLQSQALVAPDSRSLLSPPDDGHLRRTQQLLRPEQHAAFRAAKGQHRSVLAVASLAGRPCWAVWQRHIRLPRRHTCSAALACSSIYTAEEQQQGVTSLSRITVIWRTSPATSACHHQQPQPPSRPAQGSPTATPPPAASLTAHLTAAAAEARLERGGRPPPQQHLPASWRVRCQPRHQHPTQ